MPYWKHQILEEYIVLSDIFSPNQKLYWKPYDEDDVRVIMN